MLVLRRWWQSTSSPYWNDWKEHRTRVVVQTSDPGPVLERAKWFGALARHGVFSAGMPLQASLPIAFSIALRMLL